MIVLVANSLPPAVRGKLKLWFEEPRPNVFVSGITDALADNVVDMLMERSPPASGLLIFKSIRQAPHFRIYARHADEAFDVHIRTAADYRKISTDRTWLFDK